MCVSLVLWHFVGTNPSHNSTSQYLIKHPARFAGPVLFSQPLLNRCSTVVRPPLDRRLLPYSAGIMFWSASSGPPRAFHEREETPKSCSISTCFMLGFQQLHAHNCSNKIGGAIVINHPFPTATFSVRQTESACRPRRWMVLPMRYSAHKNVIYSQPTAASAASVPKFVRHCNTRVFLLRESVKIVLPRGGVKESKPRTWPEIVPTTNESTRRNTLFHAL